MNLQMDKNNNEAKITVEKIFNPSTAQFKP